MKKIILLSLVVMLTSCASVFETPFDTGQAGYAEAQALNINALDAWHQAKRAGRHFDCSDFAAVAMMNCADCRTVTVSMRDSSLFVTDERHAFVVTADGWAVDIQSPVPYRYDPDNYLLLGYAP
jgi:hypothetical protein